jgi:hypothetical protein
MSRRLPGPLSSRSWSEAIVVFLVGVGFVVLGGGAGIASAIGVGIVWLLLPMAYAVTLGYGLLTALTIGEGASLEALVVGVGLFVMLVVPAARLYRRRTLVAVTLLTAGVLLVVFGIVFAAADALWVAAGALAVTWAVAAYGIHRYERMILGLAGGSS